MTDYNTQEYVEKAKKDIMEQIQKAIANSTNLEAVSTEDTDEEVKIWGEC